MKGRVLGIEDDAAMLELLRSALTRRGYAFTGHASADEALAALESGTYDVVVTDLNLKGMNGIELCERIATNRPDVPVIVVTAFGSLETAVSAIRAGAYDFVTKPFDLETLALALDRALQHRALREEVKRLRVAVAAADSGPTDLIGTSAPMKRLHELVERVADTDASVLVTGESGTGKELVARALHARSRRGEGPFVATNCAAVPAALLESELFGHVKGAFTDARAARSGLFLQASGGTLFLDEIGELPLPLQPKLLRALQERKVRPVGSDREIPIDVRIVSATNRHLETMVEDGTYRDDLYWRVNVIRVDLPPLRSRGPDVLLLAQHFLSQYAARAGKKVVGLSSAAAKRLLEYAWPGNVRELQNCMEHAVVLANTAEITVDDLPERIRNWQRWSVQVPDESGASPLLPLEEMERRYILRVLEAVAGNKSEAARILGLDRKTLYRKLERYAEEGKL